MGGDSAVADVCAGRAVVCGGRPACGQRRRTARESCGRWRGCIVRRGDRRGERLDENRTVRAEGEGQRMSKIYPDERGRFGEFGGKFMPETQMNALEQLEKDNYHYVKDPEFKAQLHHYLHKYSGRPTSLYYAENLTKHLGGAKIYLKREDLNHTGAHKINNCLGQGLLAKMTGKKRVIAETGAGQHGEATTTVSALLGLECTVFMGEEDIERQKLNVFRMKLMGAEVIPAKSGTRTLKDATNEAIRHWVEHVEDTFYI